MKLLSAVILFSSFAAVTARADVVMDWNATAAGLPIPAPPVMARVLAATHGAMHDAINAIEPRYEPFRFRIDAASIAPPGTDSTMTSSVWPAAVIVTL